MSDVFLKQLFVYPVKSLSGFAVNRWDVVKTGLRYDRKWMLIDENGVFLSQRSRPRMTLIRTRLTDNELILSAPGMPDFAIDLDDTGFDQVTCTVWHDTGVGGWLSPEADEWFSDFLHSRCRLVRQLDDVQRPVDARYGLATDQVAFSDGFPFLMIAENSLAALNQAMNLNLEMERFRPNLVVAGCPAYAEDTWREIAMGALNFRLPKPCSRCAVPTIDRVTAQYGKEPLATLNRVRKWQNKVYFGQNALHDQEGVLMVGDPVDIKVTGPAQPPLAA
jgi:uncharacterized protein YcbX